MAMRELDYITISDLQRVRIIMSIFRDLLSPPDDEKAIVGKMLGKWSDELYAALPELDTGEPMPEDERCP